MATVAENLALARERIAKQLSDITLNPKPSYSIDGKSVGWTEHFNSLTAALKTLREEEVREAGPRWDVTQALA